MKRPPVWFSALWLRAFSVAGVSMLLASSALADTTNWQWVWVLPEPNPLIGWHVFQGTASVNLAGAKFEVTLDGISPNWEPSLRLRGTIIGGNVAATGVEMGTDAAPWHCSGTYGKVRTKPSDPSKGFESDRISLKCDDYFIGLYREIHSDK